ncbi:winged helix DNA-binding domain-containing protein [Thermoactinospora rubra]|uniref:winged helix DNA-binding domain-containing protein n=1 Tax=Thermoactinospora rubra TaxID=1088767 RepID=UPI001F0A5E46|nr:winged helix DNA-binding domain-containing protein [Thermoactinospora rubra]
MVSRVISRRVISRRALNRATLARQLLLSRHRMPAMRAVEHLVGLQAQAPQPPYFGLWCRLAGFRPAELADLLVERRAVRIVLMRGTVHLVSAEDCLTVRPLVQPVLTRYLAAFGPASVADLQTWSGLTGLREVVERLRPRLVSLTDEHGGELLDLPEAPRPGEDGPAPVRLLAPFDNLLLSHADRTRIISEEHRRRVITVNGQVLGTVLVDGFVRGVWRRDKARVRIELFAPQPPAVVEEIAAEAAALAEFAEPGRPHRIEGLA